MSSSERILRTKFSAGTIWTATTLIPFIDYSLPLVAVAALPPYTFTRSRGEILWPQPAVFPPVPLSCQFWIDHLEIVCVSYFPHYLFRNDHGRLVAPSISEGFVQRDLLLSPILTTSPVFAGPPLGYIQSVIVLPSFDS